VPISRVEHRDPGRQSLSRVLFPLRLNQAHTIHSVRGANLELLKLRLPVTEKTGGLSYVALSRVKHPMNLLLHDITLQKFLNVNDSKWVQHYSILYSWMES